MNLVYRNPKLKKAVIALHGWTGNKNSLQPIAKVLNIQNTEWFFPEGPYRASIGGFSWYDGNEKSGWTWDKSFNILSDLITDLIFQGFPRKYIFLLGFSQGACFCMEFMIRQNFSIGGIIPIAGFIRYKKSFNRRSNSNSKKTPVLLIHGEKDGTINPDESKKSFEMFKSNGYKVQLHLLGNGHKISIQAGSIIEKFMFA